MANVYISSAGTSGPRGNGWLNGVGVPASSLGLDGDFYIDTTNNGFYYGPKTAGVWGSAISFGVTSGTPISAIRSITSATVTANAWDVIEANATVQPIAVTLPANSPGVRVTIKKMDNSANAVTVLGAIDNGTNLVLTFQNQAISLVADGTQWIQNARAALANLVDYPATTDARYVQSANLDTSIIYEPSLKMPAYRQNSSIQTEFQAGHGFTASGGTFNANNTADFVRGTQSALLTTPGDSTFYSVTGAITSVDSTGKIPRITVKVANINTLNSLIVDYATDNTFTNGWSWTAQGTVGGSNYLTSGDWVTQSLSFADATQVGSGSRSGLTALRFRVRDTGAPVTVGFQMAELIPDASATWPNGVVSITFDDSYQDSLDLGKPKLDQYGYPATTFVIADRIGLSGRYTLAELTALQNDNGWELSCHAFTDAVHSATFTGITAAQLDADARAMKAYAITNGFRGADLIAYPKGQYGVTTDNVSTTSILQKYFASGLTTVNKTKEVYPMSDPWRGRRVSGISSFAGSYSPATITGAGGDLDKCLANKNWLILCFHEVVTTTPTSSTQILQSDFNSIIDAINAKGIPVVPVGEVIRFASVTATAQATIDLTDIPKNVGKIGSPGTGPLAAPWDHVHPRQNWMPEDQNLISWTQDPSTTAAGQLVPAAGTVNFARLHVPVATTISNLWLFCSVAGSGLTSGQNFAGLYTSGGTLLSATADQTTAWGTTGIKTMALTAPQAVAAGDYLVGFFYNGTTAPTFVRGISQGIVNVGLTSSTARFGTAATGQTTSMPASIGTLASGSNSWWIGLS